MDEVAVREEEDGGGVVVVVVVVAAEAARRAHLLPPRLLLLELDLREAERRAALLRLLRRRLPRLLEVHRVARRSGVLRLERVQLRLSVHQLFPAAGEGRRARA